MENTPIKIGKDTIFDTPAGLVRYGEKVRVRDSEDEEWQQAVFLAYIPQAQYPVITVGTADRLSFNTEQPVSCAIWTFMSKLEFTRAEIAEKLGIEESELIIL